MSYQSALGMLKKIQNNTQVLPSIMNSKAAQLASHSRLKNVAVVVNNKPHGVEIVFKPMVGATVETEKVAKTAKALAAKLATDSKDIAKGVVQ
jgi:hypothetical protein